MADFSFLSDTDDSAVEELISQAQDLSVLEQVSAINCSGFTDSVLPTELDTRFRKLKSFPLTKPKPSNSASSPYLTTTAHHRSSLIKGGKTESHSDSSQSDEESGISSPCIKTPDGKKGSNHKLGSGFISSPVNSSNSSMENAGFLASKRNPNVKKGFKQKSGHGIFHSRSESTNSSLSDGESAILSPSIRNPDEKKGLNNKSGSSSKSLMENVVFSASKQNPNVKKGFKQKSRNEIFNSRSESSNFSLESRSPSPPRKICCFWCSPKRNSSICSAKEQKRILKEAMKEEEKISREAEKIIKMAKQASARMNITGIEDELTDDDTYK